MAKIKSPLFSESASGTVADCMTFSRRKSGQQVRFQRKQKDIITTPRTNNRLKYTDAVNAWNNLEQEIKEELSATYAKEHMTCYNYFVQQYILGNISVGGFSYYGTREYAYFIYGKQI